MAKCKTPPTTPGEQIAQQILNNYDIKSAEDVQDVLKQIFEIEPGDSWFSPK